MIGYDRYAARRDGEFADANAARSLRGASRPLDLLHRHIPGDRRLGEDQRLERRRSIPGGGAGPHDNRRPRPPPGLESRAFNSWPSRTVDVARSRPELDGVQGRRDWLGRPTSSTPTRVRESACGGGDSRRVGRRRSGCRDGRDRAHGVPPRCHPAATRASRRGGRALSPIVDTRAAWPRLSLDEWRDTYATLHMWTQIVGKTCLALARRQNHWWQVALHVTARGLATGPMSYGSRTLDVEFDFVEHELVLRTDDGAVHEIPLRPRSVAEFYRLYLKALETLAIRVTAWPMPVEVDHPIRFADDQTHASYDPEYANRFWRILVQADDVFKQFRERFLGKCSPVHFFWGSFDLAVTRFSGRRAPERAGADRITREAYSHEVISCGFWPGDETFEAPAFYSYTVPEPPGLSAAALRPSAAWYNPDRGLFLLRYEDVRSADAPEQVLLEFLQSTYEAGATLAQWDRETLEREAPSPDGTHSQS